ncbi:MAG: zinc-ribbon domain containing protein [Candidatus Levybacteria bacterium]|nr:zinc-ribbon domain containing protein [Candidatus Levybacteria bacterium]
MPSKFITCVDCQQEFEFTEREQDFFTQKEFTEPKRCPACRAKKKAKFASRDKERERYPRQEY